MRLSGFNGFDELNGVCVVGLRDLQQFGAPRESSQNVDHRHSFDAPKYMFHHAFFAL